MKTLLPLTLLLMLLSAPAAAATRVAVLYFDNTGNPELEMLRLGLAQMLISDLAADTALQVVERQRLNEVLAELELQRGADVDPATAVRMGELLGAERLVLGSYFEFAGTLRLDARVVQVDTGQVLGSVGANGQRSGFMELERELAEGLVPHLRPQRELQLRGASTSVGDPPPAPAAAAAPPPAPQPRDPPPSAEATSAGDPLGAALAFSEGLDLLDRKDIPRAREALERALTLDPTLDEARQELARIKL